jgi:hypothetical protein
MTLFQTLIHPTDFDEPSKEAFRVARSLAHALGAGVVVFHVVLPPAVVTHDGRVILDPHDAEPVDLWAECRPRKSGRRTERRPRRTSRRSPDRRFRSGRSRFRLATLKEN